MKIPLFVTAHFFSDLLGCLQCLIWKQRQDAGGRIFSYPARSSANDDQLLGRSGKPMLSHLATHITHLCRLCALQLHSFAPPAPHSTIALLHCLSLYSCVMSVFAVQDATFLHFTPPPCICGLNSIARGLFVFSVCILSVQSSKPLQHCTITHSVWGQYTYTST